MKNDDKTTFLREMGSRIREEREYLGLSREVFAEIVDLSPFYIGQIERGDRSMSIDSLIKISDTLKLSLDYVLKGSSLDISILQALDSAEDYLASDDSNDIKELLRLISKLPRDKVGLVRDMIKLILPHIK